MSEENVETVRTALRALDQRDVDGYLRVASPDIEVINRVRDGGRIHWSRGNASLLRGTEGVR